MNCRWAARILPETRDIKAAAWEPTVAWLTISRPRRVSDSAWNLDPREAAPSATRRSPVYAVNGHSICWCRSTAVVIGPAGSADGIQCLRRAKRGYDHRRVDTGRTDKLEIAKSVAPTKCFSR